MPVNTGLSGVVPAADGSGAGVGDRSLGSTMTNEPTSRGPALGGTPDQYASPAFRVASSSSTTNTAARGPKTAGAVFTFHTRTRAFSRTIALGGPARLVEAARHAAPASSFRTDLRALFLSRAPCYTRGRAAPASSRGSEERHGVSTTGNDRPPDLPPRAGLRKLRRRRFGAGVPRQGRERAGRVHADGPRLRGRHQLLRHRRRLWRGPERDLHRLLAEAEGIPRAGPDPPQLQGVPPRG